MKGGVMLAVAAFAMVLFMVRPGNALNCAQVDTALVPCVPFLTGSAPVPASGCCDGVRSIKSMVASPADKQAACNCVKEAANRYTNIKDDAAAALPNKCGVDIGVPISRSVDCTKVY
ncbi:Bifunctional inhibitor/plant lipid transfer protein/seed storage helical domain [Dillenia turbinata]|uniref:Non-specific lipid-transfer protein n=1 Tax=Dillenia turbinata TaxID=194707 RepID=A0AAN8W819_9MAGN